MATNLERTGMGIGMGKGGSKPAPLIIADIQEKGHGGVTTNLERLGTGMGIGGW